MKLTGSTVLITGQKSDIHKLKAEVGPGVRLFKVEQIPPPEGPLDASRQTDNLMVITSGKYLKRQNSRRILLLILEKSRKNGSPLQNYRQISALF